MNLPEHSTRISAHRSQHAQGGNLVRTANGRLCTGGSVKTHLVGEIVRKNCARSLVEKGPSGLFVLTCAPEMFGAILNLLLLLPAAQGFGPASIFLQFSFNLLLFLSAAPGSAPRPVPEAAPVRGSAPESCRTRFSILI